jgi:DNA-binding transcriptional regulator YdaS (Cro superfamily)
MNEKEALMSAIEIIGGQHNVAELFNISQSAVSQWVKNGVCPPNRVLDLSRATDWVVPCNKLAPRFYPEEIKPQKMKQRIVIKIDEPLH